MARTIHVAAGVILNAKDEVLLALRPLDKHQGGLWEFPGGKVEADEPVRDALVRELLEELNLEVIEAEPLLVTEHNYGDRHVKLDVWVVRGFSGEPHGREGQTVRWFPISQIGALQFPAANLPIVNAVMALR